ncbi:Hpt domain-containing protein [Methylocystis sp. JAN1]|uniref:Hpt domain-containing protein n=1 Tax=Methylocystis sp. JAN1 TaxID=3397211 RepID=UPI003FA20BBD
MAEAAPVNHERQGRDVGDGGAAPILDLVHLSRQTFGDHSLEMELLTLFDRQAEQFSARLSQSGACDGSRADLAHTLKGSARAIGAFALGDAAEAYEAALRGGSDESALRERLVAALSTVRAAIADLCERA